MGKKFDIDVSLNGKDNGASSAVDKLAQKIKILKKEQRASGENGLEGALKSPTSMADTLGDLVGVGKVGIAAVIMDQLAAGIGRVTSGLKDVHDGKKTWGELFGEDLPRSIPVVGQFYGAIRDLRFELSGARKEQEGFIAALNKTTKEMVDQTGTINTLNKSFEDHYKGLTRFINNTGVPGQLGNQFTASMNAETDRYEDMKEAIRDLRSKAKSLSGDAALAELDKANRLETRNELAHQGHADKLFELGGRMQEKTEKDSAERLSDVRSKLRQNELEALGQHLAAQLEAIKQSGIDQKNAIEHERKDAKDAGLWTPDLEKSLDERKKAVDADTNAAIVAGRKKAKDDLAKLNVENLKDAAEEQIDTLEKQKGPGKAGFEATLVSSRFQGINSRQGSVNAAAELQRQKQIELLKELVKSMERQERARERDLQRIALGAT